MDYLGDKINSFTSEALTGINELKRKRKRQKQQAIDEPELNETTLSLESQPTVEQQTTPGYSTQAAPTATGIYGFDLDRIKSGPLSGGVPFGGDSPSLAHSKVAPTIGFNLVKSAENTEDKKRQLDETGANDDQGSSLSLYEGDTWSRLWFQRVMILTLIRLLLFIRKVYGDYASFRIYSGLGLIGHCLISAATLLLPTIVFTIYRIARYLQIALPSVRVATPLALPGPPQVPNRKQHATSRDLEDAQSRRALMSSPSESLAKQPEVSSQLEEDGLATARQTPTNLNEEFHDTQSEQQVQLGLSRHTDSPNSPIRHDLPGASTDDLGRKSQEPKLESVDVNKLGNIPDKQTTRIILGASEQLLHGILFIFWQLKRQVDVVGYLVERSCLWRRPKETELQQLGQLRFSGDGLEWFQDFYAAFLAILVQVYSFGAHWAKDNPTIKQTSSVGLLKEASPLSQLGGSTSGDPSDKAGSTAAKALGYAFGLVVTTNGDDLLIMSEIVVSCMVVVSLLVAVRRQDDGPLTLGLSMLGWGSTFAARIIVIALSFVHIGWHLMLPLVVCHIVAISAWIYKIAMDSHNGKADESEEHRWTQAEPTIEDAPGQPDKTTEPEADRPATSLWSTTEHLTLICQVVFLFAIPSLFYWPIMFNLKLHARPFKYLALILSQNFLLIAAIWYQITSSAGSSAQWYLLGTVGACSIVGFIFIALYVACKPSLTEYFARADEIINQAEKSGIYYEFCSRVFKMPDLTKHAFTRLMNQQEHTIVKVVKEDEQTMTELQLDREYSIFVLLK